MKINIPSIFTKEFEHLEKVEFFRRILYILLLFNALTLLPIAHELFSYYGLPGHNGWITDVPWYKQGSRALLNILSHPATSDRDWVYMIIVAGQIIFLITGILRILPVLSSVAVYICTVNLFLKGGLAFTGGEALVNLMLFYLMFIHKPRSVGLFADIQNILNNTFYWILLLQVCVLYFFTGVYKLLDSNWLSGNAIMYVSRIDAFSNWMLYIFRENYWLSAIATYSVIIYQLLFSVVVWIKRIKIPFLIYGVVFHLLIAFGMGIFNFGLIMIVMYILFLDEKHILWLKSLMKRKKKAVATS